MERITGEKPLFSLGTVEASRASIEVVPTDNLMDLLQRHQFGRWSVDFEEDKFEIHRALMVGSQIFSVHELSAIEAVYIITEPDKERTQILLQSEY